MLRSYCNLYMYDIQINQRKNRANKSHFDFLIKLYKFGDNC